MTIMAQCSLMNGEALRLIQCKLLNSKAMGHGVTS
jgi:hypothetical protein